MKLLSEPPRVTLAKSFSTPADNAVAAARTCYSSRIITDDDVRKNIPLRDRIADSTYKAGHHTTLQHAHFEFALDGVSRQALWSFFHAHPFYNSEQVSQRYVEVKAGRVLVPDLHDEALTARYRACVDRQMATYHRLNELLQPAAAALYYGVFPARAKRTDDKRWASAIQKRCQEVARYVLPVATHAHLYHTVSGITLHRYHRLAAMAECPSEVRVVVLAMIDEVKRLDPDFFRAVEDVLPAQDTHEAKLMGALGRDHVDAATTQAFIAEFDAALEGKTSSLVAMSSEPARIVGAALREVFGVPSQRLDDEAALAMLLDPQQSPYLGESLNLNTLGKAMRALELVHFTFRKKLSHSADSQDQRHRMTPGARPVLWTQIVPGQADYITPRLFLDERAAAARLVYEEEMGRTWDDIGFLAARGVDPEAWQYLLPNAVPVRFTETGSLLDQHHKWTTRLCFTAQEEIWRASLDEVEQVTARAPSVGKWLQPPCGLRARAGARPVCPEGERFCGVTVWKKERSEYLRVL